MNFAFILEFVREKYQYRPWVFIACGVAVCALFFVAFFCLHPAETELFATPLDTAQTGEVDARLAEWGIAHGITDGSIRVDARQRNELLLRLALVGLPHPHIATSGETLAKLNALTPDAVFQAQSRAGIAGDLAVALRGIDGVADAGVVIAPAVMQAFSDQPEVQASAAVRLSLRPGMTLTASAIEGIRTFVASGVPGLERERVTILDDHGTALSAGATHDDAEATRVSLQSAFDEAFGVGTTIVRVHVRYDLSEHHEHEIRRLPVTGNLRDDSTSEHLKEKQRIYERMERHDEHGTIVREEITQSAQGRPISMAVAVLIDQRAHLDEDRLRVLAAATAGLDLLHGDSLVVETVAFSHQALGSTTWGYWNLSFSALLVFLMIGIGFWVGLRVFRKNRESRLSKCVRNLLWKTFPPTHRRVELRQQSERRLVELYRLLNREPAYMAAAVIGRLPEATAAGLLKLYSDEEREAIVARMSRSTPAYLGDWEKIIGTVSS